VTTATRWRRFWWWLPLVVAVIIVTRERQAFAAALVAWSEFTCIRGVYFAPSITAAQRSQFFTELEQARARLVSFYGPLRATPLLIVADAAHLSRLSENSTAVTYYQPRRAMVLLGPQGQNVDVLAHELAHAELLERVGYFAIEWCIPTWFDEGLAVQFDHRPFYSEDALALRLQQGWRLPPVHQLARRAQFFTGGRDRVRFHYASARVAVADWLHAPRATSVVHAIESLGCSRSERDSLEDFAF
jgi:hypothetical protein